MSSSLVGLVLAIATIALVLAGTWAIARLGQRAAIDPPSARLLRRLALAAIAFAVVQLGLGLLVLASDEMPARVLLYVLNGAVLLGLGLSLRRQAGLTA